MVIPVEVAGNRPAREVLAWSRTVVDPALRAAVDTLPGSTRHIAGYHFGWWDEGGHPVRVDGGKAVRPALALLAAEATGGVPDTAVPGAVAVELVHNFSLLHDDVMDADTTRRHRPTAWHVFGRNGAILAGNALLALAFEVLAGGRQPTAGPDPRAGGPGAGGTSAGVRMLAAAVQELLDGQHADLAFEERPDVDLPECVRMSRGKTGALLGCACALGAWSGGGSPEQVERLRAFGQQLGLAFQHVDDLLGIWGDPAVTGKPVHSDLHHRKKSLPVVAALVSGTPAGRELAALYRRDQPLSGTDLVRAAELVDAAGGRAFSQAQAEDLVAQALRELHAAGPKARAAAELSALAGLVTHRDR